MDRPRRLIHSLSGTVAAVILAFLILSMLILSTYWYLDECRNVEKDFADKQGMTQAMLRQSVIWIDRGVVLYELLFEPEMKDAMSRYQDAYHASGENIGTLNLSELQRQFAVTYGGEWDLYLIEDGTIINTTFPEDLNLDFKKYTGFYQNLENYRQSGDLIIDRAVKGFAPGAPIRKFGYQGTPDHRYILEISRNFRKFHPLESKASYKELTNSIAALNPSIYAIELYNSQYTVITGNTGRLHYIVSDPDTISLVKKAFSSKKSYSVSNGSQKTIIDYVFLPVEESSAPSTPMMHLVARIIYSTEPENRQYLQLTLIYLCFIIITTLTAIMIAIAVSRHLTKPLTIIGDDADRIASGDLDHQISRTGTAETERIENSIAQMVEKLKEKITTLQLREEELSHELSLRKKAEERYRMLFDSSHEAIFILERGIVRECNQEGSLLLKRDRAEIIGKMLSDFSPEPHNSHNLTLAGKEQYSALWSFIRSDGILVETQVHVNTLMMGNSVIHQVMVRDVTELNEMHRREIRALSQIKENLEQLAAINDQIRNPLAVISTLSDMSGGEYEEEIHEQIKRINDLINEIDRGFIETDKVRMYLRKHNELDT